VDVSPPVLFRELTALRNRRQALPKFERRRKPMAAKKAKKAAPKKKAKKK